MWVQVQLLLLPDATRPDTHVPPHPFFPLASILGSSLSPPYNPRLMTWIKLQSLESAGFSVLSSSFKMIRSDNLYGSNQNDSTLHLVAITHTRLCVASTFSVKMCEDSLRRLSYSHFLLKKKKKSQWIYSFRRVLL